MPLKSINFRIDGLEWIGGVSDSFFETPLGSISAPLKVEEIAEVEWTVVRENFISVHPINPDTQLKYWFRLPEKVREKIQKTTQDFFPFEKKDITDRYLLAYSVDGINEKYIGFTFESVLKSSKKAIYVYTQAKVKSNDEAKEFVKTYLDIVNNTDIENFELEEENDSIITKILRFLKLKS